MDDLNDVLEPGTYVWVWSFTEEPARAGRVVSQRNPDSHPRARVYLVTVLGDEWGLRDLSGDYLRDYLRRMSLLEVLACETAEARQHGV